MQQPFSKEKKIHTLRSIHRMLISLLVAGIVYCVIVPATLPLLLNMLIAWVSFCIIYVSVSWYTFYTMPVQSIIKRAGKEDGSRVYVSLFILVASFACMIAVLSIIITAKQNNISKSVLLPVSIGGMMLSWLLVHTIYTFHYAHLYYEGGEKGNGLKFPGAEKPDYLDFAYYSFCMGCTFQVSDVDTTSKKIRRVTMFHGLLAFALNTFVVALTINIIAGLTN